MEIILFESVNRRWDGQGESSQSWRERWQKHINFEREGEKREKMRLKAVRVAETKENDLQTTHVHVIPDCY